MWSIFNFFVVTLLLIYIATIIMIVKTIRSKKTAKLLKEKEVNDRYPELTDEDKKRRLKMINSYVNLDFQKINLTLAFVYLISLVGIGMSIVMWNFNGFCISVLVLLIGTVAIRLWGYQKAKDGIVLKIQEDYLKNNPANELKMFIPSKQTMDANLLMLKNQLILMTLLIAIIVVTVVFENINFNY